MKLSNQRKILIFCTLALAASSQPAHAAQGYTLRIEMQNSGYGAFTVEEAGKTRTEFTAEESTRFDTPVATGQTGSYYFTHNTQNYCAGDYKLRLVDPQGAAIAECKVHWTTKSVGDACEFAYWKPGTCDALNDSGVSFERTGKGDHHVDSERKSTFSALMEAGSVEPGWVGPT